MHAQRHDITRHDERLLALLDRAGEPVFCDGETVSNLVANGFVEDATCGWTISPLGRLRIHRHS